MTTGETYVALLGSVESGKTALIPSLDRSADHSHGLPHDMRVRVYEDEEAFSAEDAVGTNNADLPRKLRLSEVRQGAFLRNQFIQQSTDVNVIQYPMRITCRHNGRTVDRRVRVIDSGGGVMLPSDRGRLERAVAERDYTQAGLQDRRKEALVRLLQTRVAGVIFCIDITEEDPEQWKASFDELVEDIVRKFPIEPGKRRRIALTFTKTDQLFMLDGTSAARNALSRDAELLPRLRNILQHAGRAGTRNILKEWHRLEQEEKERIEIRCFPTSVFGYIHKNGCVNYSYSKNTWLIGDPELRQSRAMSGIDSDDSEHALFKYWRPMLTIDPFIYAIFGETAVDGVTMKSNYSFRLSDLFGGDDTEADAAGRQRETRGGFFRW